MNSIFKMMAPLQRMHSGIRQNPVRDWFLILTFSGLAFVSIVVWSLWTFDTVTKGGIIGSSTVSSPPIFNNSSLSEAHKVFAERSNEAKKYETGEYPYIDPSQ